MYVGYCAHRVLFGAAKIVDPEKRRLGDREKETGRLGDRETRVPEEGNLGLFILISYNPRIFVVMSVVRRSLILFTAILIFFGSGGWVLTDHFCKEEASGCAVSENEAMEDCCCSNEQPPKAESNQNSFNSGDLTSCCFSQSTYFSMPFFRSDVSKVDVSDFYTVVLLSFHLFNLTPQIADNNINQHKPPPLSKGGTSLLFETGSLRI